MCDEQSSTTNLLQKFRKERQLTLRVLAEMIGITPTSLCRIEKGERFPEYECVVALCDAMKLNKADRASLMFYFGYMEVDGT